MKEKVSGQIERVTFFNEENGFAVLRVRVDGHRDPVTVVGSLPCVTAGEWLAAEGRWVRDREHGMQFRAEEMRVTPPDSLEGIERYLGSGLIRGIGPVCARRLVRRFGREVFDVIDRQSARLEDVDGIGPERRRRIKAAWQEQKVVREIMVFLHTHGVGSGRAVRIYKTYGEQAVAKICEDPYRLARDVRGIGFRSADRIAGRLGIAPNAPARLGAGLEHVLQEAAGGEGHCALPVGDLVGRAAEMLGLDPGALAEALSRLAAEGRVTREWIGEQELVFLPGFSRAEASVAEAFAARAGAASCYPAIDVAAAIGWCEGRSGQSLSAGQRSALATLLRTRVMIVTGGPGVGKTTLVRSALAILRAKGVRVQLCAPTGRAAKRLAEATGIEAKTIHRLLEATRQGFGRDRRNPLECDALVVDEASMIDVVLFHHLLAAHPPGAALVLVGDVDQLPSVGPGNLLSDLIAAGIAPVARLDHVFRQAEGSAIVLAAHAINRGAIPETNVAEGDFRFLERNEPGEIVKSVLDLVTRLIPRRLDCDPIDDIQVLCPMNRGSLGVTALNVELQTALNPPREGEPTMGRFGWEFRRGDKVMQTENNYDKDVYNGDIGRVTTVDPVEGAVAVRYDGREVGYESSELDELAPAYAITVHKAQGCEFPAVVMPVAMQHAIMLQRNLLYTGLTRGRRLVVLVGQCRALAAGVRNARARRRCSGLLERLRASAQR